LTGICLTSEEAALVIQAEHDGVGEILEVCVAKDS